MFNHKGKIISIATIAGVLLAGYGLFVYWYVFPNDDHLKTDDIASLITELNLSKIRLDLEDGNVSSDKKMMLTLKLSGLDGGKNVIEELRKDGYLSVEVDDQKAKIQNTEAIGDNALMIRVQTDISEEKFNNFNDGKSQTLNVRTDLNYGAGDTVSKTVSTNFKKSGKSSSLGQEIAFDNQKTADETNIPEPTTSAPPEGVEPKLNTGNNPQTAKVPSPKSKDSKSKTDIQSPAAESKRTIDNYPKEESKNKSGKKIDDGIENNSPEREKDSGTRGDKKGRKIEE